jgi:O-antigen/teichoic acid export membrane protein
MWEPKTKGGTDAGLRKNSIWMISGQGVALLFQAIYFILIGRTLGSREYGAFVGVAAMIQVLTNFSSLGMEMVMVRDVSRDRTRFPTAWGSALLVASGGFLVVLAIAMTIGRFFLRPEVMILVPYIAFSDAFCGKLAVLASRAFQSFSRLAYTAKLTAMTNVARAMTAGALFLYVRRFHTHPTAYTWTRIYWIASLVMGVISILLVTILLGLPKFKRITFRELSEGFSFSLSNSSISIYNDIDKTFLVSLGQLKAAGIYSAAYRIVDVATTPIYSIYTAAFPRFFQEGAKGVRSAANFSRRLMNRTVLYGATVAVLMFVGSSLLPRVLGPSFAESSGALRWLCLLPLIRCFHYAWGTTITGSASQWLRTATQIGAALLNLLLNALLIPRWSWQGAAVASLLTDGALAAFSWAVLSILLTREERRNSVPSTA